MRGDLPPCASLRPALTMTTKYVLLLLFAVTAGLTVSVFANSTHPGAQAPEHIRNGDLLRRDGRGRTSVLLKTPRVFPAKDCSRLAYVWRCDHRLLVLRPGPLVLSLCLGIRT